MNDYVQVDVFIRQKLEDWLKQVKRNGDLTTVCLKKKVIIFLKRNPMTILTVYHSVFEVFSANQRYKTHGTNRKQNP